MTQSYSRQVAQFCSNLRIEDVPPEVIERAKWHILDGFACGLYGADAKCTNVLAGVVNRLEPRGGQATIWGRGETATATSAVLVNSTMVQGYELDNMHATEGFHGCSVVLPSAVAAAEHLDARNVSGERLLLGVIAGFEIGPRIGRCIRSAQRIVDGWHAPAIVSAFPAGIAAGIILKLDAEQMFQTLGIAGTQASGLMAAQFGSMVKRMQCAKNAQSGLYAALLARDGFTGIEDVFEARYGGFCTTFTHSEDGFDLKALSDGLGDHWETMQLEIKSYACAGSIQSSVNAIEQLMNEASLTAADVSEITLQTTDAGVKHFGWFPYEPRGLTAAQMHAGFCIAMQLIEGAVFVDQMIEENVGRSDLVALANRVKVVRNADREHKHPDYHKGCDVTVRLNDGGILRKTVDFRPGSARRPLTDEQMRAKFVRLGSKRLTGAKLAELEDCVWSMERSTDLTLLVDILRSTYAQCS